MSLHQVGNKSQGEMLFLSQGSLDFDDVLEEALLSYFLDHFKGFEFFHLDHSETAGNDVYLAASKIFDDPESLHFQSTQLARRLFDLASHPQIKSGDFYVAYIQDVLLDDEVVDCIGLFKSETKDLFLQLKKEVNQLRVHLGQGTFIGKLDKGCLIYQTEKEKGYRVAIVDTAGKSQAQYWKDAFLGVKPCENDYYHTQQVMGLTKSFLDQLPMEFETDRPDQIDMMNRSLDYFKSRDQFNQEEFAETVFKDLDVAEAFDEFTSNYRQNQSTEAAYDFDLDEQAVRQQARQFKSVLKLDRNFHVYIHGDRSQIVKGEEANGRKFYKLYYAQEF